MPSGTLFAWMHLFRLKTMSVIIKVGTHYDWFFSRDETFYSKPEHRQNIIFCPLYRMAIIYKTNGCRFFFVLFFIFLLFFFTSFLVVSVFCCCCCFVFFPLTFASFFLFFPAYFCEFFSFFSRLLLRAFSSMYIFTEEKSHVKRGKKRDNNLSKKVNKNNVQGRSISFVVSMLHTCLIVSFIMTSHILFR